jgi:hypothetical protein
MGYIFVGLALFAILYDRMWKRLPDDHPAVYSMPGKQGPKPVPSDPGENTTVEDSGVWQSFALQFEVGIKQRSYQYK